MTPAAHCARCGRKLVGTSGPLCGSCERASQRKDDSKLKRKAKAAREAGQKAEGGRPWKYFR
jgi:hypothetical protein